MDVPCALSMLLTEGDWDPIVKIVCKQTDINTVNRCESRPLTLFVIFLFTQFCYKFGCNSGFYALSMRNGSSDFLRACTDKQRTE